MSPVERCDMAVEKLTDPNMTPQGLIRAVLVADCALDGCREALTDEDAARYQQLINTASARAVRLRDAARPYRPGHA